MNRRTEGVTGREVTSQGFTSELEQTGYREWNLKELERRTAGPESDEGPETVEQDLSSVTIGVDVSETPGPQAAVLDVGEGDQATEPELKFEIDRLVEEVLGEGEPTPYEEIEAAFAREAESASLRHRRRRGDEE